MNDRELKQDLTNYLDAALQSLITGAAEDIAAYAQDIATGIVIASNQPDPEKRDRLLAEITAQGRALAPTTSGTPGHPVDPPSLGPTLHRLRPAASRTRTERRCRLSRWPILH